MSAGSCRARRAGVACAVVVAALGSVATAGAVNTFEITERAITITVPVDLVGATSSLTAERFARHVNRYWGSGSDGLPFCYGGRTVTIVPDFRVVPSGGSVRPNASRITVVEMRPGVDLISHVDWPSAPFNPMSQTATGAWEADATGDVIAHEFGHLLGIDDEYRESDTNHDGIRQPNEPTVVLAQYQGQQSLMAELGGHVRQRHIAAVMQRHGMPQPAARTTGFPDGRWHGTGTISGSAANQDLGLRLSNGQFTFDLTVADGEASGQLDWSYQARVDITSTGVGGYLDGGVSGSAALSGATDGVVGSGTATLAATAVVDGITVPVDTDLEVNLSFTGAQSDGETVTGDILLRTSAEAQAVGFANDLTGPFAATRTGERTCS
ncbi:MAG: hypothetical protein SGJ13_01835 [Actinomycetota bacterium]|nr:hypothetical protein [Actinomycetota bacterium]